MVEKVIRANRFEVVDDEGNPRMVLTAEQDTSNLTLVNRGGKEVAKLLVSEDDSPILVMFDQGGRTE